MPLLAFYADEFVLPLPPKHRFPMSKYARLRQHLLAEGILRPDELHVPPAATDAEILRCHDADYLHKVATGTLTEAEQRRIGFPWSAAMVERSRRSSGATISASRVSLCEGIGINLAGGTHHAGRDHGEGYCIFNDSPIAARALQAEGRIQRAIIIDTDVHQGNGSADICRDDPTIFTFSIHGERNFPFRKVAGDLDIGLPDGTGDEEYLAMLQIGLERALFQARADMAFWVSGADPFYKDKLGKLSLSLDGLAARDHLVLSMCHAQGIPVTLSMGGGYAADVEDIVAVHAQTIRIARAYHATWQTRNA